jgi:hypothetical protein
MGRQADESSECNYLRSIVINARVAHKVAVLFDYRSVRS